MRPIRVLVVEDSRYAADLNIRQLKKSGFDVEHQMATDETSMESALVNQPWDLILSDNCMPTFTALGALAVRNRLSPHTPFIIVTEHMMEHEINHAYSQGLTAFVSKADLSDLGLFTQRILSEYRIPIYK